MRTAPNPGAWSNPRLCRRIRESLRHFGLGLLDAALPQTCVVCEEWIASEAGLTCARCRAGLDALVKLPACHRCGRLLSELILAERTCPRCRREGFWNIAGLASCGPYRLAGGQKGVERPLALEGLITRLKYGGEARCELLLGRELAAAIRRRAWPEQIDVFVPVPMHWRRRLHRPVDHAQALAEAVGRELSIPVQRAAVRRIRHTASQTNMSSVGRRFANVEGCFGPAPRVSVTNRVVCIIDNLLVSGATVHEVSKVLRKAGAKRIYAAVVARSVPPGEGAFACAGPHEPDAAESDSQAVPMDVD